MSKWFSRLLKWIVSGDMNTSATRSALASHVAAWFEKYWLSDREQYRPGMIAGVFPAHLNRNVVFLVLGGYSQTYLVTHECRRCSNKRQLPFTLQVQDRRSQLLKCARQSITHIFQRVSKTTSNPYLNASNGQESEPIYELNDVITMLLF